MPQAYDAFLLLSFGGPEGPDDVMPFLRNVTRGRGVPDERLAEVAHHYDPFGGVSPINAQNRALMDALQADFAGNGIELPIYFGNRNWDPLVTDTVQQMRDDGITNALVFATSAYSSFSSCRQYREDIRTATAEVDDAPTLEKIRLFFDHPGFIEAQVARVQETLSELAQSGHEGPVRLAFTAHAIPVSMATDSQYVQQLTEASDLVADRLGVGVVASSALVYQSRSGPPQVPWLEPDVNDHLRALAAEDTDTPVVLVPIGFVSDHLEVAFDLDVEAVETATQLGLTLRRAGTVGTHPRFVQGIRELVLERTAGATPQALGSGPWPEACLVDCCPVPQRPSRPSS